MADIQQQAATLKPNQILEIIIRRRWIIILPLCFFLTLGLLYTLTASKVYKASTTILIQPQKVPAGYVQSIISTDNQQRINTISKLILSRTNLEKIIEEFGLYKDKEGMYLEDKIENMRERITVQQNSRDRHGTEAFSISFFYSDNPELVERIANKLATFFMDENLKARESQAIGTSEFLESELEKIKKKLESREEELSAYRAMYMGGLPDELETNLRTLDRLQLQHTDALTAIRDMQNAAARLKNQISRLREMAQSGTVVLQPDGIVAGTPVVSMTQQQYETGQRQLDELLLKYTTKHPEVIKLTKSIAKLKKKLEEEKQEKEKEKEKGIDRPDTDDTRVASPNNTVLFQHEFNLRQLENEIRNTKTNIGQIKKTMLVYQKRVEDTPKREQELQSIQRDYNNIRDSYNSLLARALEAELAVNMEKKQKGEQFRIIDYARLPQKPISPDVKKLFMFSIAIGLGMGGGIIFLLEFLNPVIRSEDEIETQIGLPILASIPPLIKPGDRLKKGIELFAFTMVSLYAGTIFLFFAVLNLKGIDKTLSFVKTYINIQ
jgi:polysaccharide chain length determinant protein (PEP-CTERM system associated)